MPQKELDYSESQPISEGLTNLDQPADRELTDPIGEVRKSINLEDCKLVIPFDYDSNEVPETVYGQLNRCAQIMLEDQSLAMVIEGYTDNAGSYGYNKKLSVFRANIVKSYFVGQGINPTRIRVIGMGEENSLKPNITEEGRRANRRVEIEVTDQDLQAEKGGSS